MSLYPLPHPFLCPLRWYLSLWIGYSHTYYRYSLLVARSPAAPSLVDLPRLLLQQLCPVAVSRRILCRTNVSRSCPHTTVFVLTRRSRSSPNNPPPLSPSKLPPTAPPPTFRCVCQCQCQSVCSFVSIVSSFLVLLRYYYCYRNLCFFSRPLLSASFSTAKASVVVSVVFGSSHVTRLLSACSSTNWYTAYSPHRIIIVCSLFICDDVTVVTY